MKKGLRTRKLTYLGGMDNHFNHSNVIVPHYTSEANREHFNSYCNNPTKPY